MTTIIFEQLDHDGNVYRSFTYHTQPWEVKERIWMLKRSFNMDHTRIMVDGKEWK